MSGGRLVMLALVASAALVAAYLAAGGSGYKPTVVADPCAPREWTSPQGVDEYAQQFTLSALDGAACELGTTREDVVLAFENRDELDRFAQEHGVGDEQLEELLRRGLVRAVDDAEEADALAPPVADGLRALVRRIPLETLLELPGFLPALGNLLPS